MCKYFNLNPIDIDEKLDWGDWFCLLAEALDAQELDAYHEYMANGATKDKHGRSHDKWKWATPDHAGTQPIYTSDNSLRNIVSTIENFAKQVMKKDLKRIGKGKGIQWCEDLGRDYILMNPEGVYFDKFGKYISDDYKPERGLKVIKIDHEGNER